MGAALKKVQGEPSIGELRFMPETVNEKDRTVDVCFTTGYKGRRSSWYGDDWNEELEVSAGAMRLGRLNARAALLDAHNRWSIKDQIGCVQRAWIEGGKAYATLRFSKREDVEHIFQDVKDGVIANISVGYRVYKYTDITERDDKIKTYRATDWEPFEISLVPVGFDPGAQVRSERAEHKRAFETEIEVRAVEREEPSSGSEEPMSKPATQTRDAAEQTPAPAPTPTVDLGKVRAEAVEAERKRSADITAMCEQAGLAERAKELIAVGKSVEEARAELFDAVTKRQEAAPTRSGHPVITEGEQERSKVMRAAEVGLMHRAGLKVDDKSFDEGARHFRSLSLLEIARELCERGGVSTRGMSKNDIVRNAFRIRSGGMQTTSDLTHILANVQNKSLRQGYDHSPRTFLPLVRVVEVPDFKQVKRTQLSGAATLAAINENGEYTQGALADASETYSLRKYGKKLAFSREAIINDDLDALSRVPMILGRAAANLESDIVWALLTANAAMADGENLFSTAHANRANTAVISETELSTGRKCMRLQKDLDGATLLNIHPEYLIGPAAIEATILKFCSNEWQPAVVGEVNTFKGLKPIVEPRLDANSATAWYLGASPAQIDMIELAYLQGQSGPYTETREGFDIDGTEIKVRHEVTAAVIDYRGFFRNKT